MINIEDTFTPKVVPASEDYPFGSIKPNSAQGADDGTRLAAVWGNDYEGFRQKAMSDANLIPNGTPDTATNSQLLDAIDARYRPSGWVPTVTEIGAAPSSHVGSTGDAHGVATQLVNGFMSAADKTKLDGISVGANVGVIPNSTINSGTHTKITYDEKGLIISGTDATTADILESTDKKYVSNSEKINIGNLSGINSGDETKDSIEVKLSGSSIVTTQGNTFNGNSELVQTTADGKLPPLDGSNLINLPSTTGTGESNTASNYGTSGTGLFDSKSGVDLRFKNIDSESGKISITANEVNHTVNLGVNLIKSDVGLGNVTNVEQLPLAYLDIDTNLTANSDTKVPSQKATKAYADTKEPLLPSTPIAPESKFLNANKQWSTISHSYTTDKNLEEDYQHINNTDRQNLDNLSGTNTGDETSYTILAKIGDGSKISSTYLPSYVDDVLEYTNLAAFPTTGEAGKIYVALDTNKTYRWSGSAYVYITSGAVDSVAGKTGVVTLVKTDVGLSDVDNTSDINKPISTAQQSALDLKANLASPVLTGTPSAPTATVGTSTTQIATTAFVNAEIANDAAPSSHVGATGTAHGVATTSVAGFMSADDKTKLDGISGANTGDQTITLTGDVTGSGTGSFATTLANSGVTTGTYKSVTVDAKGRVTAGTNPTTLAGYGITNAVANTRTINGKSLTDDITLTATDVGAIEATVATTTTDGLMSSADKTKLNGIATGANAYVHPTIDGSLHVPATGANNNDKFLKAGDTAGSLRWVTISKTDVGLYNVDNTSDLDKPISTATQAALNTKYSPTNKPTAADVGALPASGGTLSGDLNTSGTIKLTNTNSTGILNSFGRTIVRGSNVATNVFGNTTDAMYFDGNSLTAWQVRYNGTLYPIYHTGKKPTPAEIGAQPATSDIRVKSNIESLAPVLDKVMLIDPKTFNMEGREGTCVGTIAQDWEVDFPEVILNVPSTAQGEPEMLKGIDALGTIGILLKAIQELKGEIEELKNR